MARRSGQKRYRDETIRGPKDPQKQALFEKRNAQVRTCQHCGNPEVDSEGHCDECGTNPENLDM